MKVYRGEVRDGRFEVHVVDGAVTRRLQPRTDLAKFALGATSFAWGYRSAGVVQLAFALMVDALGEHPAVRARAMNIVHVFKYELIRFDYRDGWTMDEARVVGLVNAIEQQLLNPPTPEQLAQRDFIPF